MFAIELDTFQTQMLYIVIYAICTFFAFFSQKTIYKSDGTCFVEFKAIPFIISFILPWFVICFTNIGSDYGSYYEIIKRLTWENYNTFFSEEPGINIYFLIVRTIAMQNIDISIFIVKTVNIVLIYLSFFLARHKINVGIAVLSYLLLLYLPSFYLLSIALAFGLCFVGIALYLAKDSKFWCFCFIVLAAQVHNSAYLFLASYLACLLSNVTFFSTLVKDLIVIAYVLSMVLSAKIYSFIQTFSGFHYINYGENAFSGSGVMVPILYVPVFCFVYYALRKTSNAVLRNCLFFFALSSCLFNVLSYQFQVIERMEFYYAMFYCLLVPLFMFETGDLFEIKNGKRYCTLSGFLVFCYILFRGYIVLIERTMTRSGVGHYTFFNPFG